jgi:hypothetical protein
MDNSKYKFGDKIRIWSAYSDYIFVGYADPKDTISSKPCAYIIAENGKAVECWKVEDISHGWEEAA